jgi:uncharacterized protein (DUF697 family)
VQTQQDVTDVKKDAEVGASLGLQKDGEALEITKKNSLWAMGAGLVPVPGADLLGVIAIEVKMLAELARLYGVPFSEHRVKGLLASLLGGLGSVAAVPFAFSLIKAIPFVGQAAGVITAPLSAGAFTYAVGRVFTQHFASGGTFLDFEPSKVRSFFRQEFESAKNTVKDLAAAQGSKQS